MIRSYQKLWQEIINWDLELKDHKIILLIDNYNAHPDINELLWNIKLGFLPANTTNVLQPLDQSVIKNFKFHYRKMLLSKLLQSYDSGIIITFDLKSQLFKLLLKVSVWQILLLHLLTLRRLKPTLPKKSFWLLGKF